MERWKHQTCLILSSFILLCVLATASVHADTYPLDLRLSHWPVGGSPPKVTGTEIPTTYHAGDTIVVYLGVVNHGSDSVQFDRIHVKLTLPGVYRWVPFLDLEETYLLKGLTITDVEGAQSVVWTMNYYIITVPISGLTEVFIEYTLPAEATFGPVTMAPPTGTYYIEAYLMYTDTQVSGPSTVNLNLA